LQYKENNTQVYLRKNHAMSEEQTDILAIHSKRQPINIVSNYAKDCHLQQNIYYFIIVRGPNLGLQLQESVQSSHIAPIASTTVFLEMQKPDNGAS